MRVIVVGGGVIGCAVADRLAHAGHQVLLCERDRVGTHASGAAAGLLAPSSEADEPGEFHDLAVRSLAMFDDLAARLETDTGVPVEFRRHETLRIAFDDRSFDALRRRVDWQTGAGMRARLLDADAVKAEEPEVGEVAGAAVFPEAQVTPPLFTRALARAAAAAGADIREGTPVLALVDHGVRLADGVATADAVVLAAGPWTPQVALTAGLEVPIRPRRGQLIALAPRRPLLKRMLTSGHHYLVPKPSGALICGSTEEEVGFDATATVAGAHALLGFAKAAVPALADVQVERLWAALRPAPPDDLPLIGPTERDGVYLATGHNRNGILLAPITAQLVEESLARG